MRETEELLGKRIGLPKERAGELRRQFQGLGKSRREIGILITPSGWDGSDVMFGIAALLRAGNEDAAKYFGAWCSNVCLLGESEVSVGSRVTDASVGAQYCIGALADRPELCAIVRQNRGLSRTRLQEVIFACTDYIGGDSEKQASLLDELTTQLANDEALALTIATALSVKPSDVIKQRLVKVEWFLVDADSPGVAPALIYLLRAGTVKDADMLAGVAKKCPSRFRKQLDDAVRWIRIRLAVSRVRGAGAKR